MNIHLFEFLTAHIRPLFVGVHCGMSFFLDAGNGKCCMWIVDNVEIYFTKRRFMAQNSPITIYLGYMK